MISGSGNLVLIFDRTGFSKITYAIPIEPGKFAEAIELSRDCELSLITDDLDVPDVIKSVPGADRGPHADSPRGVVDATG